MIYFTLIFSNFFFTLGKRDLVFELLSTNDTELNEDNLTTNDTEFINEDYPTNDIELINEDNLTTDNDTEIIIS